MHIAKQVLSIEVTRISTNYFREELVLNIIIALGKIICLCVSIPSNFLINKHEQESIWKLSINSCILDQVVVLFSHQQTSTLLKFQITELLKQIAIIDQAGENKMIKATLFQNWVSYSLVTDASSL